MFERTIDFANVVNGTGSLVLTDDLETYGRIGAGLTSEGAEWLQIGRGYAERRAGRAWRPARQEFDQRGLHPQHVRRLARLHGERYSGAERLEGRAHARPAAARGGRAMTLARGTPDATLSSHRSARVWTISECEQFLVHEARLLDAARFDEWLGLFTADGLVLGAFGAEPSQST